MKNRILLDNYYLPGQLEQRIEEFVEQSGYSRTEGKDQTKNHRARLHLQAIAA